VKRYIVDLLKKHPLFYTSIAYCYLAIRLYSKAWIKAIFSYISRNKQWKRSGLPRVLQFPVTANCNMNCIMCNIESIKGRKDLSVQEYRTILINRLFSRIESVGINGGEPFLYYNLVDLVGMLCSVLPKIRNVYIITNGYFTEKLLTQLPRIKSSCAKAGVMLHLSISIDGVGAMHDAIRCLGGAFLHVEETCRQISSDREKYCDTFQIICTVTKVNVYHLTEVDVWAKENRYPISYNVGTLHKRLHNEVKYEGFSVLPDVHSKMMAIEFFYRKFAENKSKTYFALYKYLLSGRRATACDFANNGCTLDSDGQLYYCATYSKSLGLVSSTNAYEVFESGRAYREELLTTHCATCSHYVGTLNVEDEALYRRELLKNIINPIVFHK
jgi:MoaA/NifB/PqqE/SkfB family radical SAM enzyme